eukprot:scaffold48063_cov28-Tisochrysis_lutea.AAC.3
MSALKEGSWKRSAICLSDWRRSAEPKWTMAADGLMRRKKSAGAPSEASSTQSPGRVPPTVPLAIAACSRAREISSSWRSWSKHPAPPLIKWHATAASRNNRNPCCKSDRAPSWPRGSWPASPEREMEADRRISPTMRPSRCAYAASSAPCKPTGR